VSWRRSGSDKDVEIVCSATRCVLSNVSPMGCWAEMVTDPGDVSPLTIDDSVRRRDLLGGLIHDTSE